jgi:RHS repeat-associated protein
MDGDGEGDSGPTEPKGGGDDPHSADDQLATDANASQVDELDKQFGDLVNLSKTPGVTDEQMQDAYDRYLSAKYAAEGVNPGAEQVASDLQALIKETHLASKYVTVVVGSLDLREAAFDSGKMVGSLPSNDTTQKNVDKGGEPIELFTGQFVFNSTDIVIAGAGINFAFCRVYKNQVAYRGPLGANWDHGYNLWIWKIGETHLVRSTGALREDRYVRHPRFGEAGFNYWVPPDGVTNVIVEHGNSYACIHPGGVRYIYETYTDLANYHILHRIEDRFGNYLAFRYDTGLLAEVEVNHPHRLVKFEYDEFRRISLIKDYTDRIWRYFYDDFDDLVGVTLSATDAYPTGLTTQYEYSTSAHSGPLAHNLLRITDPAGNTYLENQYGIGPRRLNFNRVVHQRFGNGQIEIEYETVMDSFEEYKESERPAVQVNFTDRNGQRIHYVYNKFGNLLLREEYISRMGNRKLIQWRYRYNADGALLARLTPGGRLTQYYYGRDDFLRQQKIGDAEVATHSGLRQEDRLAFSNLLAVVRRAQFYDPLLAAEKVGVWGDIFPDVLSSLDPSDVVIKVSYESDYGQPLTVSDPRFTERADPNHQEGPSYAAALTRYEYTGPLGDPHRFLSRIDRPEPTWPDDTKPGPVVEQFDGYDTHGRLGRRIDPEGGITEFHYFPPNAGIREGYLRQQTIDPGGLDITTEYEVDDLGRVTAVHHPRSVGAPPGHFVTRYEYNDLDQVVKIVTSPPLSYLIRRSYDPNGKLERQERDARDESGADLPEAPEVQTWAYDEELNLLSTSIGGKDPSSHLIVRSCYDGSGNLIGTTLPNGNQIHYRYDERSQLVETTLGAWTPDVVTVKAEYDGDGQLQRSVSARGYITEFTRDVLGRVVERRDALGHRTRYSYDKAGKVIVARAFEQRNDGSFALLARSEFQYDLLSRLTRVGSNLFDDPLPAADIESDFLASPGPGRLLVTEAYYDAKSRLRKLVDPLGRAHTFHHDPADRIREQQDPVGNRAVYRYDGQGNLTRRDRHEAVREPVTGDILSERVFAESRAYDELDRVTSVTDSLGNSWSYSYDSRSNRTRTADPLGNVTRVEFDIYGRPIASFVDITTTGLGGGAPLPPLVTRYGFDGNGNITNVTDPLGRQTNWVFDAFDRCRRMTYPDLSSAEIQYDADGNIVSTTDNNGLVRLRTIDALGRTTRVEVDRKGVPAGITVEGANVEIYAYDGLGRLREEQNDFTHRQIAPNSLNWIPRETVAFTTPAAPMANVLTLRRTFNDAGERTGVIYPEGRELRFTRNASGQITRIESLAVGLSYPGHPATTDQHSIAAFDYSGLQRSTARLGNGATTSWSYDGNNRAIQIQHFAAGGAPLVRLQQLFDAAGNVRLRNEFSAAGNVGESYRYDSAYRLTRTEQNPDPPIVDPRPLAPPTADLPDLIAKRQADIDALIGPFAQIPGSFTWAYDNAGNRREERPLAGPPIEYVRNQLDQYTTVDGAARTYDRNGNLLSDGLRKYRYDSLNRLVRVLDEKTGADIVHFFYDATGRRILEISGGALRHLLYDWLNVITEYQGGVPSAQFVHGDGVDHVVAVAAEQAEHWYHADFVGSVRHLTDRSGAPAGEYRYSPFGVMLSGLGPYNPIGYAGARWNAAIESYDCRARQYDPRAGRFLQRDPVGARDGMNRYIYAGNNPLGYRDPLGLDRELSSSIDLNNPDTNLWDRLAFQNSGSLIDLNNPNTNLWHGLLNPTPHRGPQPGDFEEGIVNGITTLPISLVLLPGDLLALGSPDSSERSKWHEKREQLVEPFRVFKNPYAHGSEIFGAAFGSIILGGLDELAELGEVSPASSGSRFALSRQGSLGGSILKGSPSGARSAVRLSGVESIDEAEQLQQLAKDLEAHVETLTDANLWKGPQTVGIGYSAEGEYFVTGNYPLTAGQRLVANRLFPGGWNELPSGSLVARQGLARALHAEETLLLRRDIDLIAIAVGNNICGEICGPLLREFGFVLIPR